jgi:uncharacterized protein YbjT (DUF2867 family)
MTMPNRERSAATPTTAPQEEPLIAVEDRERLVLVTGAAGLVGSHTCAALAKRGWKIRALVRDPVKAATRLAHLPVTLHKGDLRDEDTVIETVQGCDAVVHLAAIAIERNGQTYERSNIDMTRSLLEAAARAGVDRFVYMSQNGSDSKSPYRFLRSKGLAEDAVTTSTINWTVFRPSVIFGPEDEFVNVLARLVRLTPIVYPLPDGGRARFQPIAVRDVAQCVAIALDRPDTVNARYSLGGPMPLSLREIAERILLAMRAKRHIVGIPVGALRPIIAIMEKILPSPPVTSSLLDLLGVENTIPDNALQSVFGVAPTPFAPEELSYLQQITAAEALKSLFRR